jgi:hypothetical protein
MSFKRDIPSEMCADLLNIYYNRKEKSNKYKKAIMETTTLDIMCATEYEEFFYQDTEGFPLHKVVPEGEPIGVDIDTEDGVELVLFSNIYWNPQY